MGEGSAAVTPEFHRGDEVCQPQRIEECLSYPKSNTQRAC